MKIITDRSITFLLILKWTSFLNQPTTLPSHPPPPITMSSIRQRSSTTQPGSAEKAELMRQAELKEQREASEAELSSGQKFVPPQFTVKELLNAIPAHCYERSALRSSVYIVQDVIAIGLLSWASYQVDPTLNRLGLGVYPIAYKLVRAAIYTFISIFVGLFGTGLWVIAHECGHQAFSPSKRINNAVGWVIHSALLVPYHSWRISHGRHHAATGHMTRDEVFVPKTRSQQGFPALKEDGEIEGLTLSEQRQQELEEAVGDAPIAVLFWLIMQQLVGWQMYLMRNASGQKHYPKFTNHFKPSSIIFRPDHKNQVIASDLGFAITLGLLGVWTYYRGFREVAVMYIIPYLWVNHWLVSITFLQHTDPLLPHYRADAWTFARGALCTIDRTFFGPLGDICLHGICETHVAHHISSKIPHYNAWEATAAVKEFTGDYYMISDENFMVSLWKNFRSCKWVEDTGDVVFFKNARGVAQRVAVEQSGGVSDSGVDVSADK